MRRENKCKQRDEPARQLIDHEGANSDGCSLGCCRSPRRAYAANVCEHTPSKHTISVQSNRVSLSEKQCYAACRNVTFVHRCLECSHVHMHNQNKGMHKGKGPVKKGQCCCRRCLKRLAGGRSAQHLVRRRALVHMQGPDQPPDTSLQGCLALGHAAQPVPGHAPAWTKAGGLLADNAPTHGLWCRAIRRIIAAPATQGRARFADGTGHGFRAPDDH